jgi:signal transduction histidine kinase
VAPAPALAADSPRLAVLEDATGRLGYDDVRALPAERFRRLAGSRVAAGYTGSAYWLRIEIGPSAGERVLELGAPILDRAELFRVRRDGGTIREAAGDSVPFGERALPTRRVAFALPPGGAEPVFVRVSGVSPINLDVRVWSAEAFRDSQTFRQLFNGAFFGVLAFALAYNLFIFVAIRDRSFGYYVGYLAIVIALHLRLQGYSEELLWPASGTLANLVTPFLIAGVAVSAAQFQRVFLATARAHPRIDRLFRAAQVAALLAAAATAVADTRLVLQALLAIALATTLVSAAAIIAAFRAGFRPARYLLVSVVCLLPSYAIAALAGLGAIEPGFFAENANRMAVALESVLFSFALADRIRILDAERRAVAERLAVTQRRMTETLIGRQDEDRRRIAGELHDAVGQNLVVLRNRLLPLAGGRVPEGGWPAIDALSREAIDQVRTIAGVLHPPELQRLGLGAALAAMLEKAVAGTTVTGTCACSVGDAEIAPERSIHLYRIAQEAVTNALKHANAGRIEIALRGGDAIELGVADDGAGVPAPGAGRGEGFGISGMRERARLAGGTLTIGPRPGGGTAVTVRLPAEPAA